MIACLEILKKSTKVIIVTLIIIALMCFGSSFALWQITLKQEDTNIVTTGCLRMTFQDKNPISLIDAMPTLDSEGNLLKPYEFKIENICDSYATYQINLEVLDETTLNNHEYIKTKWQNNDARILTSNKTVDNTTDNNLRYIGKDPNNYIKFNDELWRIIGVMNNVTNKNKEQTSRIKIIRDEPIGSYSYNTTPSNINSGHGINEWSQAAIMKLLNPSYEELEVGGSLYWNSSEGMCYNEQSMSTTPCNFTNTGLKDESKDMIDDIIWNTGSNGNVYTYNNILTREFYTMERSTNIGRACSSGSNCNDTVERTTTWVGKVGLMYPSDYGYATKGGQIQDRNSCLNTRLYDWNQESINDCKENNWLYKTSSLTMTPLALFDNSSAHSVAILAGGKVGWTAATPYEVYPVVYLKQNIKIVRGNSTKDNPYELET